MNLFDYLMQGFKLTTSEQCYTTFSATQTVQRWTILSVQEVAKSIFIISVIRFYFRSTMQYLN